MSNASRDKWKKAGRTVIEGFEQTAAPDQSKQGSGGDLHSHANTEVSTQLLASGP